MTMTLLINGLCRWPCCKATAPMFGVNWLVWGLSISPSKTVRDLLASYLQVAPIEARARCVDKLGWQGDVFVTASESIGRSTERVVFQNTNFIEPAQSVA